MKLRSSALATVALVVSLLGGSATVGLPVASAAPATPAFGAAIDAYAAYDDQDTCDPTAKPGALALRDLLEAAYPATTSFGIGRDCAIGGTSEHKEGRAYDWGVNAANPAQLAMAQELLTWLLATDGYGNRHANARRLGIMYVIWNRQMWKAYAPDKGWQPYSGASPHTDHVHFSLSRKGGSGLTSWYAAGKPTVVPGSGYWLATDSGKAIPFAAPDLGGLGARPRRPVVGMASMPSGRGYWQVATDGGIFAFGDAPFLGSTGGAPLDRPVVGMASTPSGQGYWLVAQDGGVFTFGDAVFAGSTGDLSLNKPIVGMASSPSGRGYWLVASDGGIFAFGDAAFLGSYGGLPLARPIVGMAARPNGAGYWLVAADGGVFSFGDAGFWGSTGGTPLVSPVRSMAATPTGAGYWLVAADGGVFPYGDAPFQGSAAQLGVTVVGIARFR